MKEGSSQGETRLEAELLGFQAYFRFTAEHPALYRIIRQAEFVSPEMLHYHYDRLSAGYIEALREASATGEIAADVDPEVTAWALMGLGELIGMRWILWGGDDELPDARPRPSSSGSSAASSRRASEERRHCRRPLRTFRSGCSPRPRSAARVGHPRAGRGRRSSGCADEAHRGGGRARERPRGQRRASGCSRRRGSIPGRSTRSCTTARPGRTGRCGRRRRTSRTGSAAGTRSRSSSTTSRTGRRSRCASRATCCAPSPSCGTILMVACLPRVVPARLRRTSASRFTFNFGDGAVAGLLVGDARPQRGARRAHDHRRLVLAAREGGARRVGRPGRLRGSWTSSIRRG